MLDNIKLAADAATLSPVALFLQADIIVKAVMIGLLAASVYVWAVIIGHGRSVGKMMRASERFERDFWRAGNIDKFYDENGREELPSAKVLSAGISEWRRSTAGKTVDREGTRERLGVAMNASVEGEVDRLAEKIGPLATIGAVAPFVGLFGTVWGIKTAFEGIALSQNTSLAVVAPGIAEALVATALGLLAAIPAVIMYNKLATDADRISAGHEAFADEFTTILSRQIEAE